MITSLIKIRVKQISRELQGIGILRFVFLSGLFAFLGFVLFLASRERENAHYLVMANLLVFLLIHVKRKDRHFLITHFSQYRYIFQAEYLLLSAPFSAVLIYHAHLIPLAMLFAGSIVVSFIEYQPQKRSLNTPLQKMIPDELYEWKAGSRKLLFFILPLWIIGLLFSFFTGSVPVIVFILGMSVLGLYETGEPYQMILAFERSPGKFLIRKIQLHIMAFTSVVAPLIVAFVWLHSELWYIAVIEYLLFVSLHIYVILSKYAYYEPNETHPASQTINALGALGVIIPIFLPAVWLFSVVFYFRATNRLNDYLDDFN